MKAALSEIPLVFKPSYEMALALVLGVIYAVDISKPALAWIYVSTARQTSCSLGFHTRPKGADATGVMNKMGMLFWVIYYFEKTLSLRLGRCSAIPDAEITVPFPTSSTTVDDPRMDYYHQMVRYASLAGRTYEKLYSANALSLPDETRRQRVSELSQELQQIRGTTRAVTVSPHSAFPWLCYV